MSRRQPPGGASAGHGASAASGAAASGSNDDDLYERVIIKLNNRRKQAAPDNPVINQAEYEIGRYEAEINQRKSLIIFHELQIKSASVRRLQSNIHAGEKNIKNIKDEIKHLQSIQKAEEYKIDIEILKETNPDDKETLKNLQEELEELEEDNRVRQTNYHQGSTIHPNRKLHSFKNYSEDILKELHLEFDKNYKAAIEHLANKIEDLIHPLWVYGQMQQNNREKGEEAVELVDSYMAIARDILDGFDDKDIKSNPSIILLKEQYDIDLKKLRSHIEKLLKHRAEQYYGLNRAAAGAAQLHPEGGPSEGGGRRKKTRRSRNKRHVTAKYRK